jgi:hypothetical protein
MIASHRRIKRALAPGLALALNLLSDRFRPLPFPIRMSLPDPSIEDRRITRLTEGLALNPKGREGEPAGIISRKGAQTPKKSTTRAEEIPRNPTSRLHSFLRFRLVFFAPLRLRAIQPASR